MKNISCGVLFLMVSTVFLIHAITEEEVFLQANATYRAGNYQGALDTYALLEKKGSATWYNMGNAAYHLQNFVDARIYWQRALKNASIKLYDMIEHNNKMLDKRLGHTFEYAFNNDLSRITERYARVFDVGFLQIITLFMCFLLWYSVYKKQLKILLIGLGIFLVLSNSLLYKHYIISTGEFGVICNDEQPIYAGPNVLYAHKGNLNKASIVNIVAEANGWYKIKKTSLAGWIPLDRISNV